MVNFQKLAQNTRTLLTSSITGAVLSLLLSVLIGRITGETGLGVYAASLAWIYPISLIVEFGVSTAIIRGVAQEPSRTKSYLSVAIPTRLLMGSLAMVYLMIFASNMSNNPDVVLGIQISAPLVMILPLFSTFSAIFRAQQRMKPVAYLNIGMLLTQVTLTTFFFVISKNIQGVFILNTLTSFGQVCVAGWLLRNEISFREMFGELPIRQLLQESLPFAGAAILAAIQSRILIIMLEQYSTPAQIGYFAILVRLTEAGRMLPHAYFDSLFPMLNQHEGKQTIGKLLQSSALLLGGYGTIFGLGLWLIGTQFVMALYGEQFGGIALILQIGAWVLLPALLKSLRTLYWYARQQENFVNAVTIMGIGIQTTLAIWLFPTYGALAAAFIWLVSESIMALMLWAKR